MLMMTSASERTERLRHRPNQANYNLPRPSPFRGYSQFYRPYFMTAVVVDRHQRGRVRRAGAGPMGDVKKNISAICGNVTNIIPRPIFLEWT